MKFINPYNFVPLPKEKGKKIEKEEPKYTGYIEYELLTKTPLFIANTTTDKAFSDNRMMIEETDKTEEEIKKIMSEHKRMDFFSYHALKEKEDTCYPPVIPGSEIRGMLRSNYEILTNSCLSVLDEDAILSKRTAECFKAGLIKKTENGFELYEAVDHLWRTQGANNTDDQLKWKSRDRSYYTRKCYVQKDFQEGQKVLFSSIDRGRCKPLARNVSSIPPENDEDGEDREEKSLGYVIKGEDGPEMAPAKNGISSQKHCCHIFAPTTNRIDEEIPLDLKILERVLHEYRKNGENAYDEYDKRLKLFIQDEKEDEKFFPVYYSIVPGVNSIYLSPAVKTREVYSKQLKDIVKGLTPCKKKENLCPACSLFGTLLGKTSVASKVRFSDLNVIPSVDGDNSNYYDKIVTLYPLSAPKISNVEFYMKRPDERAAFWTYDYYVYVDKKEKLYRVNQPEINGRKFFWHHPGEWNLPKNVPATTQNMTIRPVKRDVTFEGRVYFEKLTETELKQLIWLLNAGDTAKSVAEKKHGYKLGAAKPLGLGSVAVAVKEDGVKLRKVQCEQGAISYKLDPYREDMGQPFADRETVKEFCKIMEFDYLDEVAKGGLITYPMMDGQKPGTEGFKWFVENHYAVRFDKDTKGYVEATSPNQRKQMRYLKYLKPLNPILDESFKKLE